MARKWQVTYFMRKFVTENCNTGGDSTPCSRGKSPPNGHPIGQVVDTIPQHHHPGYTGDTAGGRVEVGMGVTVAVVLDLVIVLKAWFQET